MIEVVNTSICAFDANAIQRVLCWKKAFAIRDRGWNVQNLILILDALDILTHETSTRQLLIVYA